MSKVEEWERSVGRATSEDREARRKLGAHDGDVLGKSEGFRNDDVDLLGVNLNVSARKLDCGEREVLRRQETWDPSDIKTGRLNMEKDIDGEFMKSMMSIICI